jgi:hypothetical protein
VSSTVARGSTPTAVGATDSKRMYSAPLPLSPSGMGRRAQCVANVASLTRPTDSLAGGDRRTKLRFMRCATGQLRRQLAALRCQALAFHPAN